MIRIYRHADDTRYENREGTKHSSHPAFTDACDHGAGCFLGSVKYWAKQELRDADIYLYPDSLSEYNICIRTGSENGDYGGPGTVIDVLISAYRPNADPLTKAVAAFLTEVLTIKITKEETR